MEIGIYLKEDRKNIELAQHGDKICIETNNLNYVLNGGNDLKNEIRSNLSNLHNCFSIESVTNEIFNSINEATIVVERKNHKGFLKDINEYANAGSIIDISRLNILDEIYILNNRIITRGDLLFIDGYNPYSKLNIKELGDLFVSRVYDFALKINKFNLSPLENVILVADLIRSRSYRESDNDLSFTHDAWRAIDNDKCVCEGYVNLFNPICMILGIPCENAIWVKNGGKEAHKTSIVYINDDKYNVHTVANIDLTCMNKKTDPTYKNYSFISNYRDIADDLENNDYDAISWENNVGAIDSRIRYLKESSNNFYKNNILDRISTIGTRIGDSSLEDVKKYKDNCSYDKFAEILEEYDELLYRSIPYEALYSVIGVTKKVANKLNPYEYSDKVNFDELNIPSELGYLYRYLKNKDRLK